MLLKSLIESCDVLALLNLPYCKAQQGSTSFNKFQQVSTSFVYYSNILEFWVISTWFCEEKLRFHVIINNMKPKNNKIDWLSLKEMPGSKDLGTKKFLILDSALGSISTEGLHALSVTRLSKTSGLSKSLILYHYPKIHCCHRIDKMFVFLLK